MPGMEKNRSDNWFRRKSIKILDRAAKGKLKMYGGTVIVKLASRCGYTLAVEVAQSIRESLAPKSP